MNSCMEWRQRPRRWQQRAIWFQYFMFSFTCKHWNGVRMVDIKYWIAHNGDVKHYYFIADSIHASAFHSNNLIRFFCNFLILWCLYWITGSHNTINTTDEKSTNTIFYTQLWRKIEKSQNSVRLSSWNAINYNWFLIKIMCRWFDEVSIFHLWLIQSIEFYTFNVQFWNKFSIIGHRAWDRLICWDMKTIKICTCPCHVCYSQAHLLVEKRNHAELYQTN